MKKSFIILTIAILLTSACNLTDENKMKTLSSQYANCSSRNITISQINQELNGGVDWIATCNNKKYSCEYNIDNEKSNKFKLAMKGKCIKI